jgi:hypothetical protein
MRSRLILAVISAVVLTVSLGVHTAIAGTRKFTSTLSGSFVTVPLDLDNDSCTTVSGITICTDLSSYGNYAGNDTGGGIVAGPFTGQNVGEFSPVAGTGCLIDPTHIQSCTLGTSTDACEYVGEGGSFVNRKSATPSSPPPRGDLAQNLAQNPNGDLEFGFFNPGGTACVDFSSFPFKFFISGSGVITGGTGKLAGITGSFSGTQTGQDLSVDGQGHDFGWFTATTSGTVTTP